MVNQVKTYVMANRVFSRDKQQAKQLKQSLQLGKPEGRSFGA